MPNCDFYALAPDVMDILRFVFEQRGWMLIERFSENDRPLRESHSTDSVVNAYPEFHTLEVALRFHLYTEAMQGGIRHERIDFKPGAVPGASFRYDSGGWGLIVLDFGARRGAHLENSHTNHNSFRRAAKWSAVVPEFGPIEAWNWPEVTRTSSRLNRYIRKIAAGRIRTWPILSGAFNAQAAGKLEFG